MSFWDDPLGAIGNIVAPIVTIPLGIGPGGKAFNNFLNPKPPAPNAPSATPSPDDAATAAAMKKAQEEEDAKRQGQAANFLTGNGGMGLDNPGNTSRATLLGS